MTSLANPYFNKTFTTEQDLLDNLITESIKIQGNTYYYLPREIQHENIILGEDVISKFGYALEIEMYQEQSVGWSAEENLLSKFGLQLSNQITFVISRQAWEREIIKYPQIATMKTGGFRPQEGDLIFEPITKSLLEIKFVKNTNSDFFQLGRVYQYTMQCEFFQYEDEKFETSIADIDAFNINSNDLMRYQILTEDGDVLEQEEGCAYILLEQEEVATDWSRDYGDDFEPPSTLIKMDIMNPFGEL